MVVNTLEIATLAKHQTWAAQTTCCHAGATATLILQAPPESPHYCSLCRGMTKHVPAIRENGRRLSPGTCTAASDLRPQARPRPPCFHASTLSLTNPPVSSPPCTCPSPIPPAADQSSRATLLRQRSIGGLQEEATSSSASARPSYYFQQVPSPS